MIRKTTAALLLQRSEWFDLTDDQEAIQELEDDGDRLIFKLSPILEIKKSWSIYSVETAQAASVELRSMECDLIILVFQTRVDQSFLGQILKGVEKRPLVAWCYLPWRRIPHPMTYEELVKGSSMYAMSTTLAQLTENKIPYLAAFGSADDPVVQEKIRHFAHAAHVSSSLSKVSLGYLDLEQPDDRISRLQALTRLGVESTRIGSVEFQAAFSTVTPEEIDAYLGYLKSQSVEIMVTDDTIRKAARSALALGCVGTARQLDYFAVPDHSAAFRRLAGYCPGIPPGQQDGQSTIFIPTDDIGAVASTVILNLISGNPCFLMRLWFWDQPRNLVVGGHGGIQNPAGLSDGPVMICGDYECVRNDPDGGAQIEFITRPGRVTLLRICETADGFNATAATGMCLESDPWIEGIPHAMVRLDCTISLFLSRLSEAFGNAYWAMTYGSHVEELAALFELKAIPFTVLHD